MVSEQLTHFMDLNNKNLKWISNWDGEEIGYKDIPVVGFYKYNNLYLNIDMDSGNILKQWIVDDEEEEIDNGSK